MLFWASAMPAAETFLVLPSGPPVSTMWAAWRDIHSPQACMPLAIVVWSGGGAPGLPVKIAMNFAIVSSLVDLSPALPCSLEYPSPRPKGLSDLSRGGAVISSPLRERFWRLHPSPSHAFGAGPSLSPPGEV